MGNLVDYAKSELEAVGLFDEDSDYDGMLGEAVMELVEKFEDQGHSGFSAAQTIKIFSRVASFEPLLPLQGTPDEWNEVAEKIFQNKRASTVFAEDENGKNAYDIDGRVFVDKEGDAFTSGESKTPITFPYAPTTEYVVEGTPEAEPFKHVFEN